MAKKGGKRRTEFRKKYQGRVRDKDLTRQFRHGDEEGLADVAQGERLSGKGELTRKRNTNIACTGDPRSEQAESLRSGRVLSVHGVHCKVLEDGTGQRFECAIRQVLKSLHIDARTPVVAGDHVRFRAASALDGMIEHVDPRSGMISRTSRGQRHVLVANVDYMLIVGSAAQPAFKPALMDRFLLTAFQCRVVPVVVINKIDLIDPASLQQFLGVYATLGVRVLMTSATQETNIGHLRRLLRGRQTALAGQSGVGKSSLLNAVEPELGLAVGEVSEENEKGRHTTTTASLIPLRHGGAVFDTPGIRQFQLWDIAAEEVAGLMPDLRPFVSSCRYPDCLHLHEDQCAVKNAVADGRIDARRYDSYCHLLEADLLAG